MTEFDPDETVILYTEKAMALATRIQTGEVDAAHARRATESLAEETLTYFRTSTRAGGQVSRAALVRQLDVFEARVRGVYPDFGRVLGALARLIENGKLAADPDQGPGASGS
jgi:hypothetical protein